MILYILLYTFLTLSIVSVSLIVYRQLRAIVKDEKTEVTFNITVNGDNFDQEKFAKQIIDGMKKAAILSR